MPRQNGKLVASVPMEAGSPLIGVRPAACLRALPDDVAEEREEAALQLAWRAMQMVANMEGGPTMSDDEERNGYGSVMRNEDRAAEKPVEEPWPTAYLEALEVRPPQPLLWNAEEVCELQDLPLQMRIKKLTRRVDKWFKQRCVNSGMAGFTSNQAFRLAFRAGFASFFAKSIQIDRSWVLVPFLDAIEPMGLTSEQDFRCGNCKVEVEEIAPQQQLVVLSATRDLKEGCLRPHARYPGEDGTRLDDLKAMVDDVFLKASLVLANEELEKVEVEDFVNLTGRAKLQCLEMLRKVLSVMLATCARSLRTRLGHTAVLAPAAARFAGGIRILEEAHKAQENLYMHQEDERLLAKMIANHPELSPEYQGIKGIMMDDAHKVEDKVKMIFMKHGIPPVNKALVQDIVDLVATHPQSTSVFFEHFVQLCASDIHENTKVQEAVPKTGHQPVSHMNAGGRHFGGTDQQVCARSEGLSLLLTGAGSRFFEPRFTASGLGIQDLAARPRVLLQAVDGAPKATLVFNGQCTKCQGKLTLNEIYSQWATVQLRITADGQAPVEVDLLHPKRLALTLRGHLDARGADLGPAWLAGLASAPTLWTNLVWYFRSQELRRRSMKQGL
eukprot:g2363.t1